MAVSEQMTQAWERLIGETQRREIMAGTPDHYDAVTWHEMVAAIPLAAFSTFLIHGEPTSEPFRLVIDGLPGPTFLFWAICGLFGWTAIAGILAARLACWRPHHNARTIMLALMIALYVFIAGAWVSAGGYVAAVAHMTFASAAWVAFDSVMTRNGPGLR